MKKSLLSVLFFSFLFVSSAYAQGGNDISTCALGVYGTYSNYSVSGDIFTFNSVPASDTNIYENIIYSSIPGVILSAEFLGYTGGTIDNPFSNPKFRVGVQSVSSPEFFAGSMGIVYSSNTPPSVGTVFGDSYNPAEGIGTAAMAFIGHSGDPISVQYRITCRNTVATPTPTLTLTPTATPTLSPVPAGCYPFTSGSLVAGDWALINYDDDLVFNWSNSEIGFNVPAGVSGRPFILAYGGDLSGVAVEYNIASPIDISGLFPADASYISMSVSGGASLNYLWACAYSGATPTPVLTPLPTATINATAVASVTPLATATIIPTSIPGGGSGGSGGGWSMPTPMPMGSPYQFNNPGALEFLSFFVTVLYATNLYWPIVTTILIMLAISIVFFILKRN